MTFQQYPHRMNDIVIRRKADNLGYHVFFDAGSHDRALRIMHSLQLPQLPQSGFCLSTKPSPNPTTARTNNGTAISIVVITRISRIA
jgi:hypothetical protein